MFIPAKFWKMILIWNIGDRQEFPPRTLLMSGLSTGIFYFVGKR